MGQSLNKVVVLMYHSIGDNSGNPYDVQKKDFICQMKYLADNRYIVESVHDYYERKQSSTIPEKYVVLTFDDGYKSFLLASEILNQYSFRGTFFITKNWCLEKTNFLDQDDIRRLSLSQDIGSHSVSHANISKLSKMDIFYELADSKTWLEDITGHQIKSFSIPGGYFNSSLKSIAKEAGYEILCNSKEWWHKADSNSSFLDVNRVAIRAKYGMDLFEDIISRNIMFFLRRRLRMLILVIPKYLLNR
jgi:peptidoglycan/xylan/chitin deacetylase (PgdA/CDA1 family)